MKERRLTRSDRRELQGDTGQVAERIAAEEYNGWSRFKAGNFDLARDSGAVAEVKSCLSRLSSGANGRFRLFEDQHEALVRQDRNGTGRYVFVLFDIEGEPTARLVQQTPAHVGAVIRGRGGWNQSGHSAGRQHKLPFSVFFDA
jgi:hypothetical protein